MLRVQDFHPPKDFSAQVHSLRQYIHAALGWTYRPNVGAPDILMALQAASMVRSPSGLFQFRGEVVGQAYKGQNFELVDVTATPLPEKTSRHPFGNRLSQEEDYSIFDANNVDTFRGYEGIVLSMPHYNSFQGHTIVRRDIGRLNPRTVNGLKRVGFASSKFEEIFEVYSSDQVEARYLLTPDFIERLTHFSDDYLGRGLQCVFLGNRFHVALEIDDRFDFSRDFQAFDYQEAAAMIVNEVGGIFYLLEKVHALQARIGREGEIGADIARGKFYRDLLQSLIPAIKGAEAAFQNPTMKWQKEQRHVLPLFCESLHGLLSPRV